MENNFQRDIIQLYNSENYRRLTDYYGKQTFWDILNIERDENMHSRFLAWLLSSDSNHGLGCYPMQKFLQLLVLMRRDSNYAVPKLQSDQFENNLITNHYKIVSSKVKLEKEVKYQGKKGRIDLFITLRLIQDEGNEEEFHIIIENKVASKEHGNQTELYYHWAKQLGDSQNQIFVFLTPDTNRVLQGLQHQECVCKQYLQLNYQYLSDYVIEPCKKRDISQDTLYLLEQYTRCLSRPYFSVEDDNKEKDMGGLVMAINEDERKLLRDFWEGNHTLLLAVFEALSDDDEIEEENRTIMKDGLEGLKKYDKDTTKYIFNEETLGKRKLVLMVVKAYVKDHADATYDSLTKAFPDSLCKSFGVIRKTEDIKDDSRFYSKKEDIIDLADGSQVAVCNQWSIDLMKDFLKQADKLGFNISEVRR